jgi:FkbH-like protein
MKLVEALEIANAPEAGEAFHVLLVCGFTALHLQTAVKARLRQRLPDRTVVVHAGLYGDIYGTLENPPYPLDAVMVTVEWADIDPRLGWRTMRRIDDSVISDAEARLNRLKIAIGTLAVHAPVTLSLPGLPMAPVFHTASSELHPVQARLRELVYRFAADVAATVIHPESHPAVRHDLRTELVNGSPYLFSSADVLADHLVRTAMPSAPKKGLITDLDETLWSGVLGDDGPAGISWDLNHRTHFHALYQELLNLLAGAGILIGVASKNDADLVRQALERRDLVVERSILFPIEAHWQPKAESIARTLEAWNIGADSVVFVDDNPLEIEQIKATFPSMECILFRRDDPSFLYELRDRFGKRAIRDEDKLRSQSLRAGQQVRAAANDGNALEDLLRGAQAKITFHWAHRPDDPRALELVNKTNQFNLNGRRYADAEWKAMVSDPANHLILTEYEDRFGKLGKIAVLSGKEENGAFRMKVWVMSCRAFSRRIEHQCLKILLDRWNILKLDFERTERNGPLQDFLRQIGAELGEVRASTYASHCPTLFHETEILDA